MTPNEFRVYREFHSLEAAKDTIQVLQENGIDYQLEDSTIGNPLGLRQEFGCLLLKILYDDFRTVNQILEKRAAERVKDVAEDHYLYQFTTEELMDVVKEFDEWSKEDSLIAQKILHDQGVELTQEAINAMHHERVYESRKPDKADNIWLGLAFTGAILGGVIGILLGYHYWQNTKTDIIGNKVYTYDEATREKGRIICWAGAIAMFIIILLKITGVLK